MLSLNLYQIYFRSPRNVIRRLKLCLLLLRKKRRQMKQPPWRRHLETLRALAALSASVRRMSSADCALNSTSAALSCAPRLKVQSFLIICTRILFMMADWFVLFVCAEVTKLKMQLEVPGSAGNLTSAADRKLEEGQRVSTCSTQTHCCMWVSGLFERLKFVCVYIFLVFYNRTCVSCASICRGWGWTCSLVKEPAVATQEGRGCATL